jgi:hypothetical protein
MRLRRTGWNETPQVNLFYMQTAKAKTLGTCLVCGQVFSASGRAARATGTPQRGPTGREQSLKTKAQMMKGKMYVMKPQLYPFDPEAAAPHAANWSSYLRSAPRKEHERRRERRKMRQILHEVFSGKGAESDLDNDRSGAIRP